MHMRESDHEHGPPVARVNFVLEDPHGLTDTDQAEWEVTGSEGESILELALEAGINIEHACGGVCACSTCHVFLESGKNEVTEAEEDEDGYREADTCGEVELLHTSLVLQLLHELCKSARGSGCNSCPAPAVGVVKGSRASHA